MATLCLKKGFCTVVWLGLAYFLDVDNLTSTGVQLVETLL